MQCSDACPGVRVFDPRLQPQLSSYVVSCREANPAQSEVKKSYTKYKDTIYHVWQSLRNHVFAHSHSQSVEADSKRQSHTQWGNKCKEHFFSLPAATISVPACIALLLPTMSHPKHGSHLCSLSR